MNKINKTKDTIYHVFTGTMLALVIVLLFLRKCDGDLGDKVNLYEHLNDSTTFYKNRLGEQVARNSVLKSENVKTFLEIESKDEEIKQLQARVKEYKSKLKEGGSVTNFSSSTDINNTTGTVVEPVIDSLGVKDTCNKTYTTKFSDKWIEYTIRANKDSTKLNLKTNDEFSVILGSERPNIFKKRVEFVEVVSSSPYTKTKSVKTYQVQDDRKPIRFSLGIQGGVGINPIRPLQGFIPYIGVGAQFNLINIK